MSVLGSAARDLSARRDLRDGAKLQSVTAVELRQPEVTVTSIDENKTFARAPASTAHGSASSHWLNATSLFFGDLLTFAASIAIGGIAAYGIESYLLGIPYLAFEGPFLLQQLLLLGCVMVGLCGWFARTGHYTERRPFREDLSGILNAVLIGVLISGFVEFANKTNFSRLWLLLTWFLAALAVPLARVLVRRGLAASGLWVVDAVMIGLGSHGKSVKDLLTGDSYLGYRVATDGGLAAYTKDTNGSVGMRLDKLMNETNAQRVILVPADDEMNNLEYMIDALNVRMIPYAVVPPIHKLPLARLATQTFLSCDAVLLRVRPGLVCPFSQAVKRIFDVVAALLLLAPLLPLFMIVSLLVMLDGGPVFFAHERIGRGGRAFKCFKFRTMVPDAVRVLDEVLSCHPEARDEWLRTRKLKNDPRITKIGNLLRVTSIDELPQLINVLRGDMSLVGPRPVVQQELREHYKDDNSYYVLVRPGLTGLWQISGRNLTNYEQRVHLDSWYVRNWSLWGDIIILFRTLPVVISGRGAY
jgi:undecaprenyl-phosphate galactose phosphotransferase